MNKLQFRKVLKQFKPFLNNLRTKNRRQKILKNSSIDQLNCLGKLFWEIASGSIPIDEDLLAQLKKKKKLKPFMLNFGTEDAIHTFLEEPKEAKVLKLCKISLVIPVLVSNIFI